MVLLQNWIFFRFVETKLSEMQLEPHFLQEFVGVTAAMSSRYGKLMEIECNDFFLILNM